MLDPKLIRNNPQIIKQALKNRREDVSLIDKYLSLDEKWRSYTVDVDGLKAKRNAVSEEIGKLKQKGEKTEDLVAEMKELSDKIKKLEETQKKTEEELQNLALLIPNTHHQSVPVGIDSRDNLEVRSWGKKPEFKSTPRPHDEIGEKLGILNFDQGAKVAGSRFVNYVGLGAALERALINFMLDLHVKSHGYLEVFPPILVNRQSMIGTGQLPKFEEEMFRCRDDDYFLVPTSEVSVTNLHRDEIISKEKLPIKYACYSPCFRREAGSYGKEGKGLIRQHQFNKVELVKFVEPEKSYEELESLTADAEKILQDLGLHYRVVLLCTADMGFAAAKTYDLEVWFPSEGKYREVSSCSNFEDFQARRADIRYRPSRDAKPEYVHTLNGSGLAIGRTFAAILENYQQEDGSVAIPEILWSYMGGVSIIKV